MQLNDNEHILAATKWILLTLATAVLSWTGWVTSALWQEKDVNAKLAERLVSIEAKVDIVLMRLK